MICELEREVSENIFAHNEENEAEIFRANEHFQDYLEELS